MTLETIPCLKTSRFASLSIGSKAFDGTLLRMADRRVEDGRLILTFVGLTLYSTHARKRAERPRPAGGSGPPNKIVGRRDVGPNRFIMIEIFATESPTSLPC